MLVGFLAELIMLGGLLTEARPPQWFWGFLLWIAAGAVLVVSAFVGAARDRTQRTVRALLEPESEQPGADGPED